MRLAPAFPLVLISLATCRSTSPPAPSDLKIDLVLAQEDGKCVVRFDNTKFKEATRAVAWTAHKVIWQVKSNACGEKTKEKVDGKALGLRHLKLRKTGEPPAWFGGCSKLDRIPARSDPSIAFQCSIPSAKEGDWKEDEHERIYEYEIDGDSVEPVDPDIGVKRNG